MRGRRLIEGRARAERDMLIGRAGKQDRAKLLVENVSRCGEVLRHFLLDGAAFLIPTLLRIEHAAHARRFDMERHIDILGRNREQILRQAFARVRVEVTAHDAADICQLVGRQARAAAEHHVLLGMRHAGEPGRGFVRPHKIVDRRRDHGRQRVPHDDDPQPVGERCTQHIVVRGEMARGDRRGSGDQNEHSSGHSAGPAPKRSIMGGHV
jgi:hypothetical protein